MKGIFVITLLVSMVTGQVQSGELPGTPVFGDDFNASGLFVENWVPSKGAKSENGHAVIPMGNSITLKRVPEGDFTFTADLTVAKPTRKDIGHCGVILDGIHFMITPKNKPIANTAYRVRGETRSRGNSSGAIPGFKFGDPCRIQISREKLGKGYKYTYKVNDNPVDSFVVSMPADGKIKFYGYKTNMNVDNFQLYALKKGNRSNNLAVNSSFEYLQEGMPNYMRPMLGGKYQFDGKWEDFIGSFSIDPKEKVSGKQCVKMTCGKGGATANGVATYNVNIMSGTPVTFSVYLKASEDDFPVTLNIWELHYRNHAKPIKITREWKRYVYTLTNPERAVVRGSVRFSKPGTVWADDLQIEIGDKATKYMPSSLDKDKFASGAKEKPAIEDDVILGKTDQTPVIDGVIEDLWRDNGVGVDKFFLKGWEKPVNQTKAYLMCDDDNLYIAVRAYVSDTSKVKGEKHQHDDLKTHSDDCIEVFLDTAYDRKKYYHLTTNAAGSKTDMGPGRILAWNGDWQAVAKLNEKEQSIDYEMKFPLELFASLDLAGKWGLNIGRNDRDSKQISSLTHTKEMNFHVPAIFPAIVFPEGVVDKYKLGVRKLRLINGGDGKKYVVGTVTNLTGKALNAVLLIVDKATGKTIGKSTLAIENGNSDVSIPVDVAGDAKTIDVITKITVAGKVRSSQSQHIDLARQLDFYTRRNYYMNEDAATVVGTLNLPGELTGRITVDGKSFDVEMTPEFAFDIPLAGIRNGEHDLELAVFDGDDQVISGTSKLVKREYRKGATQIDRQRRCLVVEGKPYLAIAPFFGVSRGIKPDQQEQVLRNMLRLHKEMGYKCFLVGAVDDKLVPKQTQAFIDLCAKEGIKVIFWPFGAWKQRDRKTPQQRLDAIKGSNIIARLIIDEPELYAKSEDVETFMKAHQKISPYTPIFMNNTVIGIPGRFAGLTTDILMLDDYLTNRENRKVKEMVDATEMMWEAGREGRKPVFYFLSGENLHNHYRECTYAEQVAETYGVIIAGGTGVSYFCSLPVYPEDYRACVDVNRELLALEEVIFSLEKTTSAKITDSAIKSMTRKLGDKLFVITLNSDNDRSADVEITLPPEWKYSREAKVKFEDRSVNVKNGKISDRFRPLERHVYEIPLDRGFWSFDWF